MASTCSAYINGNQTDKHVIVNKSESIILEVNTMQVLSKVMPRELTGHRAIIASLIGAAFTALCAKIAFYLPGNPVPVSMQVFAVIICGLLLGSKWGAISQVEYLTAGLLSAPVFVGMHAGPMAFLCPSGGYLIGFIAMAFVVGLAKEVLKNKTFNNYLTAGLLGVISLYIFGTAWLAVWLNVTGCSSAIAKSWMLGVAPFIGIDSIKAAFAAMIFRGK